MKDSLEGLIELIRQSAPRDSSPRDVADALWLLLTRHVAAEEESPATAISDMAAARTPQAGEPKEPPEDPDETTGEDYTDTGSSSASRVEAEVAFTPHAKDLEAAPGPSRPGATHLAASIDVSPRDRLRVARALHAVATRRPAGRLTVDVPRTVQRAARAGILLPVFRREVRSSTHLVVLIDTARQLDPWRGDVNVLVELVDRFRSFASHSILALDISEPTTVGIRSLGAAGETGDDAGPILAAALRPGLDNLVLIVSDAIGMAVLTGALGNLVRSLPSQVRVAWLHPWERKRWARSALGELLGRSPPARNLSPLVPVVHFDGAGIQKLVPWAHGRGVGAVEAVHLPTTNARTLRRPRPRNAVAPSNWTRKATGFAAAAEWPSVQLLALAAAVPGWLDLGLMFALGERFGREAGWRVERFHVAEVLASGFLERCGQSAELVVRIRSDEAREAALAYLDRALIGNVLEFLLAHFLTDGARASTAHQLQIPLAIIHRVYGDEQAVRHDMPAHDFREDAQVEGFRVLLPALELLNPTVRADLPWLGQLASRGRDGPTVEDDDAWRPTQPMTAARSKRSTTARINAHQVIGHVQHLTTRLKASLHERLAGDPTGAARLEAEHAEAVHVGRTHEPFPSWRDERVDQVAMAWVLTCTFVRFLEDNQFLDRAVEQGLGGTSHESEGARGRLKRLLRAVAARPGMACLLDERRNLLWTLDPTEDGAQLLLDMLGGIGPLTPFALADGNGDTSFLSDLYERLSEPARARYALVRTPEVVGRFLLDRTLEPAISQHGLAEVRLIDPACGCGTMLLQAFARLAGAWKRAQPGIDPIERVRHVLDQLAGVDQNPAAAAIARFRLLVAALRESGARTLADGGALPLQVSAGDSLLHGPKPGRFADAGGYIAGGEPLEHAYHGEDAEELRRILGRRYAVVVANPPYVAPKDTAPYSERFASCRGKFSLVVPFVERCLDLAAPEPDPGSAQRAGWVGVFAANSFMKREFGRRLVEDYLAKADLTHIIDTSGAYMDGYGTPTVILLARARGPLAETIRVVNGLRDEPGSSHEPAGGRVWQSITALIDAPGAGDEYVSVEDVPRDVLRRHPWVLGDARVRSLKDKIERAAARQLKDMATVAVPCETLSDELFVLPRGAASRHGLQPEHVRRFVHGEDVRDWSHDYTHDIVFAYDSNLEPCADDPRDPRLRCLWRGKCWLTSRRTQAGSVRIERGLRWYEFTRLNTTVLANPFTIFFAMVATHSHFVLEREGAIGARSAPGITLSPEASEDDHLALLALLNSSTACFWLKQVAPTKQVGRGPRKRETSAPARYEMSPSTVVQFPIPERFSSGTTRRGLAELARAADACARQLRERSARSAVAEGLSSRTITSTWQRILSERARVQSQLIGIQEEIDFAVYSLFGLTPEGLGSIDPSEFDGVSAVPRPFEILAGSAETDRDQVRDIPPNWPTRLRAIWQSRLTAIQESPQLRLLEVPDYKRAWGVPPRGPEEHAVELANALRSWLLDRLEAPGYWPEARCQSVAQLVARCRADNEAHYVAGLLWRDQGIELTEGIAELIRAEVIPLQSSARYLPSGVQKFRSWQEAWRLQHIIDSAEHKMTLPHDDPKHLASDALDTVMGPDVPGRSPPPTYASSDFKTRAGWRLRGKFDVPTERFFRVTSAESEADPTPVVGWAGWSVSQRAEALLALLQERKAKEGWSSRKLTPILASLSELVTWPVPSHEANPGADLERLVQRELGVLGLSSDDLTKWTPLTEVDRAFLRGVVAIATEIVKSKIRISYLFDELAHDINEVERVGDLELACENAFSPRILRSRPDPAWVRQHHGGGSSLDRRLAEAVRQLALHALDEDGLPTFLSVVTADVRNLRGRRAENDDEPNDRDFQVLVWAERQRQRRKGRRGKDE